jgi:hypothetical protein
MSLPQRVPTKNFSDLVELIEILRTQCPWDREQTHESLKDLMVEEIYEAIQNYPEGATYSEMRAMRFFGEMGFKNIGNILSYKDAILSKVPEM